jgi:hypothetical protein
MVITVGLEEALNGGEGDDRDELGFRCGGGIGQRRKRRRLGFVQNFYTAPGRVPRHTVEEGGGASARRKAPRRRAVLQHTVKMRTTPLPCYFGERVSWAGVGPCWWAAAGCYGLGCWAAAWAAVQVRSR